MSQYRAGLVYTVPPSPRSVKSIQATATYAAPFCIAAVIAVGYRRRLLCRASASLTAIAMARGWSRIMATMLRLSCLTSSDRS